DRRRRRLGRFRRRRGVGRDQVDRATHELAHHGREAVGHALAVAVFVVDALAFDVAELAQGLAEAMPHRRVVNDSDARYTRWLLLRLRRQRPRCRRAAEEGDELAALHSISSSARPDSGSGTVMPSVLAVLRLMNSSTFVACCTGRSAGFSPLRTRPA